MKLEYSNVSFVEKLINNASKVCFAYTSPVFTAGHVSTQRAESMNSKLKGHGKIKGFLCNYDSEKLLSHVEGIFVQQELEALEHLKNLIKDDKVASEYVLTQWRSSKDKCSDYLATKVVSEPTGTGSSNVDLYEVKGKLAGKASTTSTIVSISKVDITDSQYSPPSCSCAFYKSTHIPCACICCVLAIIESTVPTVHVSHLHPRWRYQNHPLYSEALKQCNFFDSNTEELENVESPTPTTYDIIMQKLDHNVYKKIFVPKTSNQKYNKTMEICKQIAEQSKQYDDYVYKNTITFLNRILNFQKSGISANEVANLNDSDHFSSDVILQSPSVLPPQRKRQRDTKSSLENRSKLNKGTSTSSV